MLTNASVLLGIDAVWCALSPNAYNKIMYIVFLTSLLAVFLTYLESKRMIIGGMKWGFIFLTFLGCIHYDYGNDYLAYQNIYYRITKYPFDFTSWISGDVWKEPGWAALCYLFEPFGGFFALVIFLNIVQNTLVYKTIKKYVEQKWLPFAVLIYVFSTSLYLLNFSMMRQGLVICVFFGIWHWIVQKKYIKVFIVLSLCVSVHKSAMILLPFVFMGILPVKNTKIYSLAFIVSFFALWLASSLMSNILSSLSAIEEIGNYTESYADGKKYSYGVGYILNLLPFFLSLLLLYRNNKKMKFEENLVVLLSCFYYIIVPFTSVIPLISRISMYFMSYQMVALPIVYKNITNKYLRLSFLFLFIFMLLWDYSNFFTNPIWIHKYTTFKTIFSRIL